MNFTVNLDAVETLFCRRQMQQSDIRALTDRLLSASENTPAPMLDLGATGIRNHQRMSRVLNGFY